jgi:hypothetical protein
MHSPAAYYKSLFRMAIPLHSIAAGELRVRQVGHHSRDEGAIRGILRTTRTGSACLA